MKIYRNGEFLANGLLHRPAPRKSMWVCNWIWIFSAMFIFTCANQQPPEGGEEDKTPPKVINFSPKDNSINFTGDKITLEFNEYVDRRSLLDAFRISPKPRSEPEFNWSGKELEISFKEPLNKKDPDKTFIVTLSTLLKDIYSNAITSPISFAFSTGPKIDKASVSGKIFNMGKNPVSVLAYNLTTSKYDPEQTVADYITETTSGDYILSHLSPGTYRIIAVEDEDRNFLYTADRESYSVLSSDIILNDTAAVTGGDFNLKDKDFSETEINTSKFFRDSLDIVRISIPLNGLNVIPEQSIFIFFNKYKPSRAAFEINFRLLDESNAPVRTVFNWRNDSLVEIFPVSNFDRNRNYLLSFNIKTSNDSLYTFKTQFKTASSNSFGNLKGSIVKEPVNAISNVIITLLPADSLKIGNTIRSLPLRDTVFQVEKILDGEYNLFAFIDVNDNGIYDYGTVYPFQPSEPFYYYPSVIHIKGGWTVENVVIDFVK